jgi:hypothetical protein
MFCEKNMWTSLVVKRVRLDVRGGLAPWRCGACHRLPHNEDHIPWLPVLEEHLEGHPGIRDGCCLPRARIHPMGASLRIMSVLSFRQLGKNR